MRKRRRAEPVNMFSGFKWTPVLSTRQVLLVIALVAGAVYGLIWFLINSKTGG